MRPKEISFAKFDAKEYGEILFKNTVEYLPNDKDEHKKTKSGKYTFLFDESGKFIKNSMDINHKSNPS